MRRFVSALPVILRIGFAEAVVYRAEMLIWIFTTAMPLIMLPLWHAVAEEAPIRGFTQTRFTAYFLGAFVVRQMVSAWASWTINYEVRTGSLNQRLLRPIHPLWFYAIENITAIPLRAAIAVPVALIGFFVTSGAHLADDPVTLAVLPFALLGAWSITFFVHVIVGAASLWMHQSIKLMDLWFAGFMVLSGYLVPVELFPDAVRGLPAWLPFVYQLGFPVNVLTGALEPGDAVHQLGAQWAWVAILASAALVTWHRGIARYEAYGG
ncbi:MAG: ABC transporter permease [Sandaracinaceae bacterium]